MNNRQLAQNMQIELNARLQAKQARRAAAKSNKEDAIMKKKIQSLLQEGKSQEAYTKAKLLLAKQAVIAQQNQLAEMADRSVVQIQAQTAKLRMHSMLQGYTQNVAVAQQRAAATPEATLALLERAQQQNEEFQLTNDLYQDALQEDANAAVTEDSVLELLGKLADDAGVQLSDKLQQDGLQQPRSEPVVEQPAEAAISPEEEEALQQRLRALRE